MKPDNIDKNVGPFFGLFLCIIWLAILFFIEGGLYPNQNLMTKPLFSWINLGLLPFFVTAGSYLMYYRKLGGIEAFRSLLGLKNYLIGFVIWLIVILLFFRDSGISYMLIVLGGYLTIIAILLIGDRNAKRKFLQNETGEDNRD